MSPTKRPFQPIFLAFVANRSMKRMSCGLPHLRLRDSRITCQVGPVIGSDSAPARQPLKSPPIERDGQHRVNQCFSCATAELAAARKRTASRQLTARIRNYTPYGSVGN